MPYVRPPSEPPPARRAYASDMSDAEWAVIEQLLRRPRPRGQPRIHPLRDVVDAIRYVLRGGIAWRLLPHDFPPWSTVWSYFRRWRDDGTLERINDALRRDVRVAEGRNPEPTAVILDGQTVKTTEKGGSAATMRPRR